MLNIKATINRLLDSVAENSARGNYKQAYLYAREALGLVHLVPGEMETVCRVYISSARSAYYMSRFDESESNLVKLEALLKEERACDKDYRGQISIIRADILRRKGNYSEAIGYIDRFASVDGETRDPRSDVSRFMIRGACLMRLGCVDRARDQLETALGLANRASDEKARSSVLATLGLLALRMGFLNNADDYLKRAADIYRKEENIYGQSAAMLNRGIVKYHLGRFADAESNISEAVSGFKECDWKIGICRALIALGNNEISREKYDSAFKLFERSQSLAEAKGFLREKALVLGGFGRIFMEAEDYTKAQNFFRKALAISSKNFPGGDVELEQFISMGELYRLKGDYSGSLRFYQRALKLSGTMKAGMEEGIICRGIGLTFFNSGDREKTENYFEKAIEILRAAGCNFELAQTQVRYCQVLFKYIGGSGYGSGKRERIDKIWRLLIEVEHLSCGIQTDLLKEKTDTLLEEIIKIKNRLPIRKAEISKSGTLVELRFDPEYLAYGELVSVSKAMFDVYDRVRFAASLSTPVLITGETGTGKELIAKLIHRLSGRGDRKIVTVNCSAVPDRLFESEFFGHKKGCFTGALSDRPGLFEEASGGSIFLDEIGELTENQQAKLLRVLQEKKIRRVGDNVEREIDVRFISATNKIIGDDIRESSMREDFYYRINEERIYLAPLRDRKEDIIPLLTFCLSENGYSKDGKIRIEKEALRSIQRYRWPGNVREFLAVVKRAGHISGGGIITADMLPDRVKGGGISRKSASENPDSGRNDSVKRNKLLNLSKICEGNKSAVARWLGISRSTLYKQLKRADLENLIR
ncbi:MAG TPA: sigma 54-interacting transcriptional regulator [Candidatus Krumholzibacteriaceae bacterium]|nr:sigma 54-interacting transcriptional regulator [Candidatus Krumholzibacteriaceae bacterium]